MIPHKKFVEMLGRKTAIAGAIQRFVLSLTVHRHTLARDMPQPAAKQPRLAALVIPDAPATKRPLTDAQQLSRLQLIELARFIATQNTPKLDQSHTLKGF
jgi:hypothetical protein